MGNKTKRNPRARNPSRPSSFFLIALLIGLALLAWAAVVIIKQPMKPVEPAKPANTTTDRSQSKRPALPPAAIHLDANA